MNESFAIQGYSSTNQMICVVEGENIFQTDYTGINKKLIGKTVTAYSELEQTTTEYYNKLVELGVIVPPKDPQEALKEMQASMLEMANIIKSLSDEVKELKRNGHELNYQNGEQNVSECECAGGNPASTASNKRNS